MFVYPLTQVTGQFRSKSDLRSSGRATFDEFDPSKPKSSRKSDQKYPNMTESIIYDPEFDVNSNSTVKITVTTRNHELQLPIGTGGQAHQLDIPTRPDRTDIRTRHRILTQKTQTCTRVTTLRRERTPMVKFTFFLVNREWRNSFFF